MRLSPADILEEAVLIPAAGRNLPGVLAYPFAGRPQRAALIIGPHPLMGGRLDNNVVRALGRGLAEYGLLTLRFQFGGQGASGLVIDEFWRTGHAPDDPQRGDDVAAVCDWLVQTHPLPILAVGYSFGASLLSRVHDRPQTRHLVMIGATLAQHAYGSLARSTLPKLLITADNDFATPLEVTRSWVEHARSPKRLVLIEAAEHFYRGQEDRLVTEILDWTAS